MNCARLVKQAKIFLLLILECSTWNIYTGSKMKTKSENKRVISITLEQNWLACAEAVLGKVKASCPMSDATLTSIVAYAAKEGLRTYAKQYKLEPPEAL